ncbi:hypothetical protein ACROYT_G002076 [Oculina patagonica]
MNLDLVQAFMSYDSSRNLFKALIGALQKADPAVALLAMEGLYRVEGDVKRGQFQCDASDLESIRAILRKWRCESPGYLEPTMKFLKRLTIFKTLDVPLFIDNYGTKKLLSSYVEAGEGIEDIKINGETPIFHDTHSMEAQKICEEKKFKPSDKNIIDGVWFGLDSPGYSVYGSKRFKTTLSEIGVTGLRQGEIVAYRNEINVILYAEGHDFGDDAAYVTGLEGLKKPTDAAVKKKNSKGYVKVTIFVPLRFLPSKKEFETVFSEPIKVTHWGFCVRASRRKGSHDACKELTTTL